MHDGDDRAPAVKPVKKARKAPGWIKGKPRAEKPSRRALNAVARARGKGVFA